MIPSARWLLVAVLAACGGPTGDGPCEDGADRKEWYPDLDGDGFGDQAGKIAACSKIDGHIPKGGDCDDADPAVNPDGTEVCDGADRDEDCDGFADDADPEGAAGGTPGWTDADGDGFGDPGAPQDFCDFGGGGVDNDADCDDTDDRTFPGAAPYDSSTACMQDTDGDEFGNASPSNGAEPGTDCRDNAADTYPGAVERMVDGGDQDCDGLDQWGLFDSFEFLPDARVWQSTSGVWEIGTTYVTDGYFSLTLPGDGATLVTRTIDTSACTDLSWWFMGKRGPDQPDVNEFVYVDFWDGNAWRELDAWEGGQTDGSFVRRGGPILDYAATNPDFKLRIERFGGSAGLDDFHIDDFFVGCPGPDGDGDGVHQRFDCNDFDPAHWSDCGICVDADNDDYGVGCDLGEDCDDSTPFVSPSAPDPLGDGLDTNCDGFDGVQLFDDFEEGQPKATTWASVTGDYSVQTTYASQGLYALRLGGGAGIAESRVLDTSVCSGVFWSYMGKRGPEQPDSSDHLKLEFWDGGAWQLVDDWIGGATDPTFSLRSGVLTAAAARHVGFKARLISSGSGAGFDDYFVDEFLVGCADDLDGDGAIGPQDCAPSDPDHWSDCGLCVDGDGDGYGVDCDLGGDCDDADPAVQPDATEISGNGVDENCDGYDRNVLADDFELGVLRPVWTVATGGLAVQSTNVSEGAFALDVDALDGHVETRTLNTTTCADVFYRFDTRRMGAAVGDDLVFSYATTGGWVELARVSGTGGIDSRFTTTHGTIGAANALWSGLALRVRAVSGGGGLGSFAVDDVLVTCGIDTDGDGSPAFEDCDDADPLHWSDCGLCVDVDGDGYGLDCDLGADCDDSDGGVWPDAPDPAGDGIDANCDGIDGVWLFDDFELGVPDPAVFAQVTGDATVQGAYVASGSWALDLAGGGGVVATQPVNFTGCPQVRFRWLGKRGPEQPDNGDRVTVAYDTPSGWVQATTWEGGGTDVGFGPIEGFIVDPAAMWSGFSLRLTSNGSGSGLDEFYIDDFEVRCFEDADGDGVPLGEDCDETDPAHWSDCGLCVDIDGDTFGAGCDLGDDCDDGDPAVSPLGADAPGDGLDTNCDGVDGVELFDDFELGAVDPAVFASLSGDGDVQGAEVATGSWALRMGGGIAIATTVPVNTAACDLVAWSYEGKRGPDTPDSADFLNVEYWDGGAWVVADAWYGIGTTDPAFSPRAGLITDPLALRPDLRLRLYSDGTSAGTDEFYVDDFRVWCDEDADGDGVIASEDCDDGDPFHWSDCGVCVDLDVDGYGPACDLGDDCDDGDPAIHPGLPDPLGDGIDWNCDGSDGVILFDDFELGAVDPAVFASLTGDGRVQGTYVADGSWALELGGGIGIAETVTADMTGCTSLVWAYLGKRGPENPDSTDFLNVEYWDGVGWRVADTWWGDSTTDPTFVLRWGLVSDPAAFHAGFKARLYSDGAASSDDYYVDDFLIGCDDGTDSDGDGVIDLFDCDPADGAHWLDCGLCSDGDGDDYGASCDLGDDCDDADATVSPAGVDLTVDGTDQDCDAIDGAPLLFDDLELGTVDPAVWAPLAGDASVVTSYVYAGTYALNLGGGGGTATTLPVDTTGCTAVAWSLHGRQGPDQPELGDDLEIRFDGGAGMVLWESWLGGDTSGLWQHRSGVITDPAAISATFRLELYTIGVSSSDDYFLDDIAVGCAP